MIDNIRSKARRVGFDGYVVWVRQRCRGRSMDEIFVNKVLNKIDIDRWSAQSQRLLLTTIEAQAKYIKLLERRIER
jgi:hypothetical protein